MNTRLNHIASECWYERSDSTFVFDQELFAESIIEECIRILKINQVENKIIDNVKKHFGVE